MTATSEKAQTLKSRDYIDGILEGLRICGIYVKDGGKITSEDIETERQHWSSQATSEPTKKQVAKIETAQSTAELREYNAQVTIALKASKDLKIALEELHIPIGQPVTTVVGIPDVKFIK